MPPSGLILFENFLVIEPDFLLAVRRRAGFDKMSVFAAIVPRVDPIVRAKFIRRPLSFLAALLTLLDFISSPWYKCHRAMGLVFVNDFTSSAARKSRQD
jgi:hypothetical protein